MISIRHLLATAYICAIQSFANANEVVPAPTVPINPAYQCPFTMLQTQSLSNECKIGKDGKAIYECDGIKVEIGCNMWRRSEGYSYDYSGTTFHYFIENLERYETYRHFDLEMYRKSFNSYLQEGADSDFVRDENDTLIMSKDGQPQLSERALRGDCGQEKNRQVIVKPIEGANWAGWMYEQKFTSPKKKLLPHCQKYTPQYKCVTLLFGNNKVTAYSPNYCFLRKKVNNLRVELSFDVFMDMIKTIRFNEGEVVPLNLVLGSEK